MRLEGQLSPTKNRMDPGTPMGPISIRCRRVHATGVGTQGAPPKRRLICRLRGSPLAPARPFYEQTREISGNGPQVNARQTGPTGSRRPLGEPAFDTEPAAQAVEHRGSRGPLARDENGSFSRRQLGTLSCPPLT